MAPTTLPTQHPTMVCLGLANQRVPLKRRNAVHTCSVSTPVPLPHHPKSTLSGPDHLASYADPHGYAHGGPVNHPDAEAE